jgi:hypothetical protein
VHVDNKQGSRRKTSPHHRSDPVRCTQQRYLPTNEKRESSGEVTTRAAQHTLMVEEEEHMLMVEEEEHMVMVEEEEHMAMGIGGGCVESAGREHLVISCPVRKESPALDSGLEPSPGKFVASRN